MPASPSKSKSAHHHRNRLLVLIAVYKFLQGMLFIAVGVGAYRLLNKDIGDELTTLARYLRFNPESRLVNFLLDRASLLNDPALRRIGFGAYCYAVVSFAEGIGLYLGQAWGEILTLAITASFLPLEVIEIAHRVTWFRISLLAINILVFIYLARLVIERGRRRVKGHKR